MTLGERIKACRRRAGLSQERLAERVGVSRQAVTKWESGQSAPSTENLLKLAQVLGVDLEELAAPKDMAPDGSGAAEPGAVRRERWRGRLSGAALTAAAYLAVFLLGRVLWGVREEASLLGWLLDWRSTVYVFGWLLSSGLFWWCMALSVLAALLGKLRAAAVSLAAFVLGILLGELLGPYPEGQPWGHGHYGWLIWGGVFLAGLAAGGGLERMARHGVPLRSRQGAAWGIAAAALVAAVIVFSFLAR